MSSSPTYLDPVVIPLITGNSLLDVGCGYGRWGNLVRSNFWEAGLTTPPIVDGLDAFQPNVDFCLRNGAYRSVWRQTLPGTLKGSWDTVLACEVLEHLPQEAIDDVLTIFEMHAARRVIISTPNWPYFRGGGETALGYNEFEAHLSYTSRTWLRKRGYKVSVAGFGNPRHLFIRGLRRLGFKGSLAAFESALHVFPSLGQAIVAYKDMI